MVGLVGKRGYGPIGVGRPIGGRASGRRGMAREGRFGWPPSARSGQERHFRDGAAAGEEGGAKGGSPASSTPGSGGLLDTVGITVTGRTAFQLLAFYIYRYPVHLYP